MSYEEKLEYEYCMALKQKLSMNNKAYAACYGLINSIPFLPEMNNLTYNLFMDKKDPKVYADSPEGRLKNADIQSEGWCTKGEVIGEIAQVVVPFAWAKLSKAGECVKGVEVASKAGKITKGVSKVDETTKVASKAGKITKGGSDRPTWRQSEIDARADFPDYNEQISFKDGKEVPYGTKGSVRPDYYKAQSSVDIKNYNVETATGRNNLANNISKQYYQRSVHLPLETKQSVLIDVRGQNVSNDELEILYNSIMEKTNNGIIIYFKTN